MRRSLALVSALALAWLLLWPVPIEPEAWEPAPPGDFQPTGDLAGATRVPLPSGEGPEDVEVDAQGRVVVGLADGRLLRLTADHARAEVLADTGGRPMGLHWDAEGRLVIADALRGLLRLEADGSLASLATRCGGAPLVFTDDLDVAPDGTIWFTDASQRFSIDRWKLDVIENGRTGRLCRWREGMAEAEEVLGGLAFANGVAVSPDGGFVLVVETSRQRLLRRFVAGPRAGQTERLMEGLPGFPDGVSAGSDGLFWMSIASPRNAPLELAAGLPWLRRVMVRLPEALQPRPERTARVLGLDAEGRVVHDLYDPSGRAVHVVTSAQERGGRLYLGSLSDTAFAWIARP